VSKKNEPKGSASAQSSAGLSIVALVVSGLSLALSILVAVVQFWPVDDLRVTDLEVAADQFSTTPMERGFVFTNMGNRIAVLTDVHAAAWDGKKNGWGWSTEWMLEPVYKSNAFPVSIAPNENRIVRVILPRPELSDMRPADEAAVPKYFGLAIRAINSRGEQFSFTISFGFGSQPDLIHSEWNDVRELDLKSISVYTQKNETPVLDAKLYVNFAVAKPPRGK
jgi:hypothetical protein